jgi:solute:Na+ symporter, SSS family
MITFAPIDILLILLYFAAILWVGFRTKKPGGSEICAKGAGPGGSEKGGGAAKWAGAKPGGSEIDKPGGSEIAIAAGSEQSGAADFMLAGRTLTLPIFVATLVSTWYGGILGIGEFSYSSGIASWVIFGAPYYLFALIFALFLASRVRNTGLTTIPDKLARHYGQPTALLGALLVFLLVTPAPYILMLGVLAQLAFDLPLPLAILLAALASLVYLYKGGFRSDVYVNLLEFVLMFAGFFLIVGFAFSKYGGLGFLKLKLPALNLIWHGGNPPQYILVWFFIALWTLVDPGFHQRCYAAKDSATARRGILVSILFWMLFDFLTTTTGLYARALLPNLENPIFAYPMLAQSILPAAAKAIFFIGLLATVMSTLSSYTFIGGMTIGNDVAGRILTRKNGGIKDARVKRWTQIGLVLSAAYGIALALALPSVVKIWYAVGTACIPGLLLPLMVSYMPGITLKPRFAFAAMLGGWLSSMIWLIWGMVHAGRYWWGIEPMYPGLVLSLLIGLSGISRARTK